MTCPAIRPAHGPRPLPFCPYPDAATSARHGLQPLPAELPQVDFAAAGPHRSGRYTVVPADRLSPARVLELARVVGTSFARREPQCRHVRPPQQPPAGLGDAVHVDAFGREPFGPWTRESLLYWFIRLLVFTDPTSPRAAVRVSAGALRASLALIGDDGRIIGGALNETMPPVDIQPVPRAGDPFLDAVLSYTQPVLELLAAQDAEALAALAGRYPAFARAYAAGAVGHHFMVARDDALPTVEAFELVAATAAHLQALGHAYMLVEASNQWTGAACETLGGVRVHFAPYRARRSVPASPRPLADGVSSADGFLSDKDSGCMFYVLRLA
jgi:hypothetical protein